MRENSYTAVIVEMTVRALWETQNTIDCIPDELWDKLYGGAPLWQYLYHTLHKLDQWFIDPGDPGFIEPPIHTPGLDALDAPPPGPARPPSAATGPFYPYFGGCRSGRPPP